MTINHYATKWVFDDYDSAYESFYVENAKDLVRRSWFNGWKHGIVAFVAFLGFSIFASEGIAAGLLIFTAMQIAYVFFALNNYVHNCKTNQTAGYFATCIALYSWLITKTGVGMWLFYLFGIALFAIVTFVIPIKVYKAHKEFEKMSHDGPHWNSEAEEFEAWRREFYGTGNTQQDSFNHNSATYMPDPNEELANELFADFGNTFAELKKRYRQLAKKYHPDVGGDGEIFKAIVCKYENIKASRFPDER